MCIFHTSVPWALSPQALLFKTPWVPAHTGYAQGQAVEVKQIYQNADGHQSKDTVYEGTTLDQPMRCETKSTNTDTKKGKKLIRDGE